MRDRIPTGWLAVFAALLLLPLGSLRAQESPNADESFEVEPPWLVQPNDDKKSANEKPEAPPDAAKLTQQLEQAKKSSASVERLVKIGALAKIDGEQRALRVIRLESELARAQVVAAQAEVASQQTRNAAGQTSTADLDAATATLTAASAAAQAAEERYRKAQLDAAALNLHRQQRLFAVGAARKSDVTRAEEKLATLQRGEQ